jgi:hypothetical protein
VGTERVLPDTETPTSQATPTSTATPSPTAIPTEIPVSEYAVIGILEPENNATGVIREIAFSQDSSLLAAGHADGKSGNTIRIWDLSTFCLRNRVLSTLHTNNLGLAFSPSSKYLAASFFGGTGIELWDLENNKRIKQLETFAVEPHHSLIGPLHLEFVNDEILFVQGTEGLEQINALTGELVSRYGNDEIYSSDVSDSIGLVAASYKDGRIRILKSSGMQFVNQLILSDPGDALVALSPNGDDLAFSFGSSVFLWDFEQKTPVTVFSAERDIEKFSSLMFSPDGQLVIARSSAPRFPSGRVYIWNIETQSMTVVLPPTISGKTLSVAVAMSSDGSLIAIGTTSGEVILFGNPERAPLGDTQSCSEPIVLERQSTSLPVVEQMTAPDSLQDFLLVEHDQLANYDVRALETEVKFSPVGNLKDVGIQYRIAHEFSPDEPLLLQADLQIANETTGLGLIQFELNGKANETDFSAFCMLETLGEFHFLDCNYSQLVEGGYTTLYESVSLYGVNSLQRVRKGTWYTPRILLLPEEGRIEFYNGDLFLGEYNFPGQQEFSFLKAGVSVWTSQGRVYTAIRNISGSQ